MWMQPNWLVGVIYFSGALWIFVTTCFNPNQQFKQLLRSDTHPNSTGTPRWQSLNEHYQPNEKINQKKVHLCAFPSTTALQIIGVGSSIKAFGGTFFFFCSQMSLLHRRRREHLPGGSSGSNCGVSCTSSGRVAVFSHSPRVACVIFVRRCVQIICFSAVKREVKSRLK